MGLAAIIEADLEAFAEKVASAIVAKLAAGATAPQTPVPAQTAGGAPAVALSLAPSPVGAVAGAVGAVASLLDHQTVINNAPAVVQAAHAAVVQSLKDQINGYLATGDLQAVRDLAAS